MTDASHENDAGPLALSPEVAAKLRALCDEVADANDLDEDLRERLLRHLADRARGYLRSDPRMQDDDAFVLVREDLRHRRFAKRLLAHLRLEHSGIGPFRRLVSAFVASMAVSTAVSSLISIGAVLVIIATLRPPWQQGILQTADLWPRMLKSVLWPFILFALFLYWQRSAEAGRVLWFARWRPSTLCVVAIAVLGLCCCVPGFWLFPGGARLAGGDIPLARAMQYAFAWLAFVPYCMAWMWWFDRSPKMAHPLRTAALCWVGSCMALGGLWALMPHPLLAVDLAGMFNPGHSVLASLFEGRFRDGVFEYELVVRTGAEGNVTTGLMMMAASILAQVALASLAYAGIRRVRARNTPPVELDFPWLPEDG